MTFSSTAIFTCDGCKVIESDEIEVNTDIMQATVPVGWMRAETHLLTGREGMVEMKVKFFCPNCAPMIDSYLSGADLEPPTDPRFVFREKIRRWQEKATKALGPEAVAEMLKPFIIIKKG